MKVKKFCRRNKIFHKPGKGGKKARGHRETNKTNLKQERKTIKGIMLLQKYINKLK